MLNAAFHTCDSLSKKNELFQKHWLVFCPFLVIVDDDEENKILQHVHHIYQESSSTHAPT